MSQKKKRLRQCGWAVSAGQASFSLFWMEKVDELCVCWALTLKYLPTLSVKDLAETDGV